MLVFLRQPAFLDDFEAHQGAEVANRFCMVAVENHPMEQGHHAALDHVFAPIQKESPGVGDTLRELGPARHRAGAGLNDLAGGDQQGVEIDQLGAGDGLAEAVFHLQGHAAFAVGLRADGEGQPFPMGAVHLRSRGAVEMDHRVLGLVSAIEGSTSSRGR